MSKKVLIVDDSSVARKIIIEIVSNYKLDISEAHNGIDALEYLANNSVDLVICDLNMPNMGGLELISKMRESARLKKTPVALITSESSFEIIDKAKSKGVIAFLVKPITPDQISTLVEVI